MKEVGHQDRFAGAVLGSNLFCLHFCTNIFYPLLSIEMIILRDSFKLKISQHLLNKHINLLSTCRVYKMKLENYCTISFNEDFCKILKYSNHARNTIQQVVFRD